MKHFIIIALLFLLISTATSQEIPKFGGTLKVGLTADLATVYPWQMTDMETVFVLENVYEPLIRLKKDSAAIEPCLATDWSPSSDFKVWTLHLRKNVKFHDGSTFNADAVLSSILLMQTFPAKAKKIDNYTVSFILDKPNTAFAITLSMEYYSIVSPATIKCFNDKEKCKTPVISGTGPFKFISWEPDKQIVLRANENYWGGKPYLNEAVFIPFNENESLVRALQNKTIHLSHGILPNNIAEIRKTPFLIFQSRPAMTLGYLGFNNEKSPFTNKKVRIALAHAINKVELVKKYFYNGQAGVAAKSCLPPPMFGYFKEMPDREYNPQKAKSLLNDAGYPNGFETTLLPSPAVRPYLPDPLRIAEDLKRQLAAAGIKVTIIQAKSWSDFINTSNIGNFDLTLFGWIADTVDPNDFLTALLGTETINQFNKVRWSNTQFDILLEKARIQNISARQKTYEDAQKLFYQEMPFVPLFNAMQLAAWNEKVLGFTLHPATRLFLQHIWLSD